MIDQRYDNTSDPVGLYQQHTEMCPHKHGIQGGPWRPCACPYVAILAHQCDEWGIGGPEDVRALIADLTALLDRWPK